MPPTTASILSQYNVDAKGLKCPMPVIKLQQQVRQSRPGDIIHIECTDLGAEQDIASWAKVNKHLITQIEKTDFGLIISLQIQTKN